jgi:hypothetical protein
MYKVYKEAKETKKEEERRRRKKERRKKSNLRYLSHTNHLKS